MQFTSNSCPWERLKLWRKEALTILSHQKVAELPLKKMSGMFDARNDQERIDFMDVVAGESASYNELY